MAGKPGRSGRRPKPDVLKIAQGTYRAKRSGNPKDKVDVKGAPKKPHFENPYADALWDETVKELVELGVATKIDAPLLRTMCELWGLYRMAYEIAEKDPTDKDARIAVVSYVAKFEQVAARFGLNPSDRGRIKIEKPKQSVTQARKRG